MTIRDRWLYRAALVLAALAALASCASAPAGPPPSPDSVVGRWEGAVNVPGLATVRIIVKFDAELGGTIDIPEQGKLDVKLTDVVIEPPRVHFVSPVDEGQAVFEGTLRGDTISGSFTQGPVTATFSINRSNTP